MRAWGLAVLLGLSGVSQAGAAFYTYFEWERLTDAHRTAYVTGALDSYLAFAADYRSSAAHISKCIVDLDLTAGQLSRGTQAFAASRPAEQGLPVPGIMLRYLLELCGAPPSN